MKTIIRQADRNDSAQLLALASQLATSSKVEENAFEKTFHELLQSDHAQLYVAELEEEVIGYVLGSHRLCFYANGRVAWVEELFVAEKHRRLSIGSMLMSSFEGWAKEKQCTGVALATRRAASFYESINYEDSAQYLKKKL